MNAEPKPLAKHNKLPVWCRHITWQYCLDGTVRRFIMGKIYIKGGITPPSSWRCCPICGAKRPTGKPNAPTDQRP